MYEVIHNAMIWLMGGVLDRQPKLNESLRLLLLLAMTVMLTYGIMHRKTLAFKSPRIRRWFLPYEGFTGRYLQAVFDGSHVRYAIVHIYFNSMQGRYELMGRTYDAKGVPGSTFHSDYIVFPRKKNGALEFIWRNPQSASDLALGGQTLMILDLGGDNYIQGTGHVFDFEDARMQKPLRFKHLLDPYVHSALGIYSPRKVEEEPEFIRKFHETYGTAVREGFSHSEPHGDREAA